MPRELAFTPDGARALIVCRDTDTVTMFDMATGSISATIAVGDFPVHVAISPNGQYALTTNVQDDTVSIIDLGTNAVVATVPITGSQPFRVEVTADSARAVVSVINDGVASTVSVLDLGTFTEILSFPTVPQGVGGMFFTPESGIFGNIFTESALAPDGIRLIVPDGGGDQVMIYDVTNGSLLAQLPGSDSPRGVDISEDGSRAVVSYLGNTTETVGVIDLGNNTLNLLTPATAPSGGRIRITPDNTHAVVAVQNAVDFVNLITGLTTAQISTGTPGDIEFSFDGQFVIVPNYNTRIISVATQSQVGVVTFASSNEGAASPVEHKFIALNNRFREDLHLYSTNGAASFLISASQSGELDEGDAPRAIALSGDGQTALVAGNTSDNIMLVDLASGSVTDYITTGQRTLGIATSPASPVAVAANTESQTASVINLATAQVEATLNVGTRPANVVISPDGSQAFILSVAGTDRVHFVDLNGAASAVTGSVVSGQTGSIGYSYGVVSGMAVSPDGSTLAVCISFDDELLLLDTQTRATIARVPVGDFPIRCSFSPDSSQVYVAHSFGDSLTQVTLGPGSPTVTGTANNIELPLQVTLDGTGDFAFVGSFDYQNPSLKVVDTQSMSVVQTVALSGPPRSHVRAGDTLFVTTTGGELLRIALAGASSTLLETSLLSGSPAGLVFSPALGVAACTNPGADDLVDLTHFGGDMVPDCFPANLNSQGLRSTLLAEGTFLAGGLPLRLKAARLPQNQFGYFLVSTQAGAPVVPTGSQGTFCLGGAFARFNLASQIRFSGATGTMELNVDTTALPYAPPVPIQVGETWHFQCWHRDQNPGNTSNFTNSLAISFE